MEINPEIFKAYDIRGEYPNELDENAAYLIGRALAGFLSSSEIIIARDMRDSSDSLFESLVRGLTKQGVEVWDIGLVDTGVLYFASGKYQKPGIIITASHLSSNYNGFKVCDEGAVSIGWNGGLKKVKEMIEQKDFKKLSDKKGCVLRREILEEYVKHTLSLAGVFENTSLKIVADAGNGMAGKTIPSIFAGLPFEIVPMYFDLDASFPNHEANPKESENLKDLQEKVLGESADLGIAFDGDGDRAFFVDEAGKIVSTSLILALISKNILEENPRQKIVYNLTASRIVPETIKKYGGEPIPSKTGHTLMKETMRKEKAIFGAETAGHYFFKDNFYSENSLLLVLRVLKIILKQKKPLSELIKPFEKYHRIEEANFGLRDVKKTLELIEDKYQDGEVSLLDGLTVEYDSWWFNLRASNTEPVLRLNMEAENKELLKQKLKEVTETISSFNFRG